MNRTVLIIEDDLPINYLLASAFEMEGYRVVNFTTCSEALKYLEEARVDLITLDLNLPKMSGYDFLKLLPGFDSGVPVLVISAQAPRILNHPQVAGIIPKPFNLDEVLDRAEAELSRQEKPA